jgi:hypothetical protein
MNKMLNSKINNRMSYQSFVALFIFLYSALGVSGQQNNGTESISATNRTDTSYHLYLLIGQSNMAGRGKNTDAYKVMGDSSVLMLDKENNWVPAKHPLHFDKPALIGVGPGLSFGMEMAKKSGGHKIGLIPCAVGGTSINVWKPGGYDEATKTHPYDDMVKRLEYALKYGSLKGVIWLQGEADSNPENAAGYLLKLEELINRLRIKTGNPTLPFVAGELGRYKEAYNNINKLLKDLPNAVPFSALASSKGFTDIGDNVHLDSESATEYGKRFAKKMKKLQSKRGK